MGRRPRIHVLGFLHELDGSNVCKGFLIDLDLAIKRGDHAQKYTKIVSGISTVRSKPTFPLGNIFLYIEVPIAGLGGKKKLYPCCLRRRRVSDMGYSLGTTRQGSKR